MRKRIKKNIIYVIVCVIVTVIIVAWPLILFRWDTMRLCDAIEDEDIDKIQSILENGLDPNQTTIPPHRVWAYWEMSARRPLSVACGTGNLEIVELLIAYGATAEPQKESGWTPLQKTLFSYQPNDVEIVTLLLQHGADPEYIESDRNPVFVAAAMQPRTYDKNKTNGTVFSDEYSEDAAKGITEIVKLLLGDRSVDLRDDDGSTLLMIAAKQGNIVLAEYLITSGCDVELEDDNGKTAYDYAVKHGHTEIAELLK